MILWKKYAEKTTVPTRISRMDTANLNNWFNTTIMDVGSTFDKYRYHNSEFTEVAELVELLIQISSEIESRNVD